MARGRAAGQRRLRRATGCSARTDLVDEYRPDLIYFDDTGLPLGQIGLEAAAHYYNQAHEWHGGVDVVLSGKKLSAVQRRAIVEDVERGFVDEIRARAVADRHLHRQLAL